MDKSITDISYVLEVSDYSMCEKICSILLIKFIKDYRGSRGQCKIRILKKKKLQAKIIAMMTLEYKYFVYVKPNIQKSMDSTNFTLHVPDYPGAG
jgi:hypothetical protein